MRPQQGAAGAIAVSILSEVPRLMEVRWNMWMATCQVPPTSIICPQRCSPVLGCTRHLPASSTSVEDHDGPYVCFSRLPERRTAVRASQSPGNSIQPLVLVCAELCLGSFPTPSEHNHPGPSLQGHMDSFPVWIPNAAFPWASSMPFSR
jgi:hypothetical protein